MTGRDLRVRETHPTYGEAEKALTRLQQQVDDDHPKSAIAIGQAVERWLEVVVLEDTTRERYDDLIRLDVAAACGLGRRSPETTARVLDQAAALCVPAPRPISSSRRA